MGHRSGTYGIREFDGLGTRHGMRYRSFMEGMRDKRRDERRFAIY